MRLPQPTGVVAHLHAQALPLKGVHLQLRRHPKVDQVVHHVARLVRVGVLQLKVVRWHPPQQEQGDLLRRRTVGAGEPPLLQPLPRQRLLVRRPHLRLHRPDRELDPPLPLVQRPSEQVGRTGRQLPRDPHRLPRPPQRVAGEPRHPLLQPVDAPQQRGHPRHLHDLVEERGRPELQLQLQPARQRQPALLGELVLKPHLPKVPPLRLPLRVPPQPPPGRGDRHLQKRHRL